MNRIKYYIGLLLIPFITLVSCSKDKIDENPSGEAYIYNFKISNGDITGSGKYDGVLDAENKTVVFTIPSESDIEHLKFEGKLSLGAKIEFDSYDFSKDQTQTVRIINVENSTSYKVTINLTPATSKPFVDRVILTKKNGEEVTAYISMIDKTVYLKTPNESEVTLVSISARPVRSEIVLTELVDNKLRKDNPGKIKLNFLGMTDEYHISFEGIPQFGGDFTKGNIFDFSANPLGGTSPYPDFAGENTRSADFDGEHILIVSREGGIYPKLLKASDVVAGNTSNPIMLNVAGVSGGTYAISAGRLSQGHIYITNLTVGLGNKDPEKLRIYHWASPTSPAEKIFEFDGEGKSAGRFGDNVSVNLDANGNGYIFCAVHSGAEVLRLKVSGFTSISEPTFIKLATNVYFYASYNQVDDVDNEYILTSTKSPITLVDSQGKELYKMQDLAIPIEATDARVINFNLERYLIATTGRPSAATAVSTFYVYDISAGFNTALALQEFEKGTKKPLFTFTLDGAHTSAFAANTGWGIVNGKLYTFAASTKSGFTLFEFPEK